MFLTGGGGEAIETAVKLARLSHALRGESERVHIISRRHGYHGTHGIGTSILGMPFKEGYGALVEDTSQIVHGTPSTRSSTRSIASAPGAWPRSSSSP